MTKRLVASCQADGDTGEGRKTTDVTIRVAGQAGQGVVTTGEFLLDSLAGRGPHVFATKSYMSRIRGGLNWYDIPIADDELFGGREGADLPVCLTDAARQTLGELLTDDGVVPYNGLALPAATGIKLADHDLEVVITSGDGDMYGEGGITSCTRRGGTCRSRRSRTTTRSTG